MFRKKRGAGESNEESFIGDSTSAQITAPIIAQPVIETFEEKIAKRFGKARSALGPGTVIQGKLSFDSPVIMEGKLSGEVFSSEALIVGEKGEINAQLKVKRLIVGGSVKGEIVATECVEILSGGRIDGDFTSPRFIVEDGGIFNGNCRMVAEGDKPSNKLSDVTTDDLITTDSDAHLTDGNRTAKLRAVV